ncbi:hypothetical protein AVEN_127786-1 [Araneus ventricosus]|uniref:Uncharacterized protein n=1 Tax=Araneus ventricosus TaxID=182803 RepID=A0A4Y2DQ26_ARAVE|nr:hypothetical protein AVEN_127786-1 [Araneus ventricosus]
MPLVRSGSTMIIRFVRNNQVDSDTAGFFALIGGSAFLEKGLVIIRRITEAISRETIASGRSTAKELKPFTTEETVSAIEVCHWGRHFYPAFRRST